MNNRRFNNEILEKILFLCVTLCIGIFFVFFYRRFIVYSWDIDYHRWFAELLFKVDLGTMKSIDSNIPTHAITYPLFHIFLKIIATPLGGNYHWACYLLLSFSNMFSIVLFKKLFVKIYSPRNIKETVMIDIFTISTILFVVFRSFLTEWRYYAVQCAANPVHNPTLLFVRPFGILTLMFFVAVLERYEAKEKYVTQIVIFSALSVLSILAKPNYAIAFLPAMGIATLIIMIKNRDIKIGIALLLSVLPSMATLLWQFSYMDNDSINIKMQFALGGFSGMDFGHVLMASVATFPVVLILFSKKAFADNKYYCISVLALLMGWFEMFFFTNGPSGDFSWGYDLAVQFATLSSLAISLKYNQNRIRRYAAYGVFAYQTICGITYLYLVWTNFAFLI